MFNLDIINILISFVGVATLSLGIVTFAGESKNRTNRFFLYFVLSALGWVTAMFFFRGVASEYVSLIWARMLYVAAACIPLAFLYFSFIVFSEKPLTNFQKYIIPIPFLLIVVLSIFPNLLILGVRIIPGQEKFILFDPKLHMFYAAYINTYFLWIYFNLIQKYRVGSTDQKRQLRFVIGGTILSTVCGVTSNLLLPLLNNFTFNWLGQVTVIFMVSGIFYAIIRHKLFNTRVIATEAFVFSLWGFVLFRIIVTENTRDQIFDGLLLIATMIIGILVIRSVVKEIQTRERMEALAGELATSNEKLGTTNAALESTNKQLEVANARLKELDRQKSEFVSIASHQLRSPLTAMKGYSSMLLEGSFGKVPDKARDAIDRIFQSSQRLAIIIDDFLNISRIEQGRMQYEFSTVDIADLVREILKEMEAPIKNAGLTIKYDKADKGPFKITADYGKIRQVVTNVIDNSIKYTPKGGIVVTLHKDEEGRKIMLEVKDTGIGIEPEVMPLLFQKFSRAEDAGKTNIQGTGLGLFVAKEIMKAHRGNIWVDSEGKDKGSTFYLQFLAE